MPTLSFSCPSCTKLHERVKPEMVGHKVRCQCGFVFRLGSKSDKLAWFSDELKRKNDLKKNQAYKTKPAPIRNPEPTQGDFDLGPAVANPNVPHDPHEFSPSNKVRDSILIPSQYATGINDVPIAPLEDEWEDGILDAIPVVDARSWSPESMDSHGDPAGSVPPPMVMPEELVDFATAMQVDSVNRPAIGRHVPRSVGKTNRNRASQSSSPAGPVWTLVLTMLGVPALIVVMLFSTGNAFESYRMNSATNAPVPGQFGNADEMVRPFPDGSQAGSNSSLLVIQMLFSIGMVMLSGALVCSMAAGAVVAIIELANGVCIGWSQKLTAVVASVLLMFLFLHFCFSEFMLFYSVREIETASHSALDTSAVGFAAFGLALRFALLGLVPMAAAINAFVRIIRR